MTQSYLVSQHGCALHMSLEIHLQCFPLETTSLFRSADIWCSHARSYLLPRHRCALQMSMKIHLQWFPIETISLSRSADIWYLGTGVRYIGQWKDISNDFLLKPFPCFSQLMFDAIIHDRISYLGTSVPVPVVNAYSCWNWKVWNIQERIDSGVSYLWNSRMRLISRMSSRLSRPRSRFAYMSCPHT